MSEHTSTAASADIQSRCHYWQNLPVHSDFCQGGPGCPVERKDAPELLPPSVINEIHAAYLRGDNRLTVSWDENGYTEVQGSS